MSETVIEPREDPWATLRRMWEVARPRRTPAEATARYRRLRQLEADVLTRRARARGQWLQNRAGLSTRTMSPDALLEAMRAGYCHWHRSFWTLVDPPKGHS